MAPISSSSSCSKYDVFISFRGTDTRRAFVSHLYAKLCEKGVVAYKDDVSLARGEEVSAALIEGIEASRISVVVFSENYATSRWCLEELVHILKCRREREQVVLPVFYEVDPSHVRRQDESYGRAFVEHQERFGDEALMMRKLIQWRSALEEAGNLSGWDSRQNRSESALLDDIANDILNKLFIMSLKEGRGCKTIERTDAHDCKTIDAQRCKIMEKSDAQYGCKTIERTDAHDCKTIDAQRCKIMEKSDAQYGCKTIEKTDAHGCKIIESIDAGGCKTIETIDACGCKTIERIDAGGCKSSLVRC